MQQVIKIGILGAGTVGSGVIKVLEMNRRQITERVGAELQVQQVRSEQLELAVGQALELE